MNIPFFNYPDVYQSHKTNILKVFDDTASKGAYILQEDLQTFESRISEYVDSKYCTC